MNPLLINSLVAAEHSADLQRAAGCCTPVFAHRHAARANTRRLRPSGRRRRAAVQAVACGCA